ncbi:MAG TPA: response regulator transcription factor [Anaerolineales bacterium]|nr:response regulator transcription factor [Anaerolineales bacterium]HND47428.1 response regulator transcription factor [Anaerolineales bacterium]HNF95227.1 response regulator transcription factor [Anaerolineales bacterium]HNH26906.1 response regulator transcription factor [Anaerolineales bacterium]HNM36937.1 response regulator transcription factor [Anaerolineales bacterium]
MPSVLVIDDDPKLLKMLQRTLTYENLEVFIANNGLEALPLVQAQKPDLIIVDWMMPKMDGISFIQRLRDEENQTMILMLTAKDAIDDRVDGLESGADDYLIKPFAPAELVARVHAMLRRVETKPENQKVSYADVSLDPTSREAKRGTIELNLTVTEFNLLHMLLRHPRQVLERRQILNEVWGYDFGGDDNVLEIYIGYLRKKLEVDGNSRLIQTVRGVGYVLREES